MQEAAEAAQDGVQGALGTRVRSAVLWRSGSQIAAQLVTWASTFLVIRLLGPADYGLFAMTQAMLVLLNLVNGWGFANALIRAEEAPPLLVRQAFGLLLLLNGALALLQVALAPLAAAYFRQPMVAELLRWQALLYLATPFIALSQALLSRRLDFRAQAAAHLVSAFAGGGTALGCALAGWGVWTLVAAPLALFWSQAIVLTLLSRSLVRPSFRFAGAGSLVRFGGTMTAVQLLWFAQSQADVLIAGRAFDPHRIGLYTTALFLTQIFAAKFVPPLNEVAFAAYAQMQDRREAVAQGFLKAVRLILLIALPFYLGMAATAGPLVMTLLGDQWAETAGLVRILAFAMPFMTLQILFAPATNALGKPDVALKVAAVGAVLFPACFLVAVRFGPEGMALGLAVAFPILCAVTAALSLPAIGASAAELGQAVAPGLFAAAAMAAGVVGLDLVLPVLDPPIRLALLVAFGALLYGGLLFAFARGTAAEALRLVLRR
ncbi:MAG TPA: lipopolysaccharide biosynthesis protein [Allosphingosinicella sp.]